MDSSDKSLVESHILGQKAAFAELVRRHGDALLRYLYRTTGNRQTAEDLFQETFRRVHEKANSFNGNNFRSWLYAIAANLAINEFRKRKRRPEISLEHIAESKNAKCENGNCQFVETLTANEKTEPGAQILREELKTRVWAAVNSLPAKQRLTLVMAYYQQMKYSEIADVLGCSTGAVKTHMFRALKHLRRVLPDGPGGAL